MSRMFRDTDPTSYSRRRIAYEKLQKKIDEFKPHRDEMRLLSPMECKTYLNNMPYETPRPGPRVEMMFEAARSVMDIPRIRMPRGEAQTLKSEKGESLYVPEDQLQMVKYNKAVEGRREFKSLTYRRRFMVSCPSPMETWKLEKEFLDYRIASLLLKQDSKNEDAYHNSRKALRRYLAADGISLAERRRGLLKSEGRASRLREVISIDEDWPQ